MAVQGLKTITHQVEVFCFVVCGLHPIVIKPHGHVDMAKPRNNVPMEVNGIKLDMRHGV